MRGSVVSKTTDSSVGTDSTKSSSIAASVHPMTDSELIRRPPVAGSEVETLIGSLERQRATFAWKCGGLDAAGLRATHAPSSMTLGGMLKHLALVADNYF